MTTATIPTTITQVLTGAADLVTRYGLYKGDYWPGARRDVAWHGQPVCAEGAIRVACDTPDVDPLLCAQATDAFTDWLIRNGHTNRCTFDDVDLTDSVETIAAWSDRPDLTAAQVAAALRACAEDSHDTADPSSLRRLPQAIEATTGGDE